MTEPIETTQTRETTETTRTRETTTTETVVLYAAQDAQGRLFLTDDRAHLPPDAAEYRELHLASTQVRWAMLQVEVEELRGTPVTIHVGGCHYATPQRDTVPQHGSADTIAPPTVADRTEKGETRCRPANKNLPT